MPSPVKEMMMREILREFEANPYAFISSFDGLNVSDVADLRRSLEKVSKRSLVLKHSFARKVFMERKFSEAGKFLKGSVLVTFGAREPQLISKALMAFAKLNQKFVPSGVIFEDGIEGEEFIKRLARLPGRQELLSQVVARIQSPISGLVLTLGQVMRGLAVALNAIREKKQSGGAQAEAGAA